MLTKERIAELRRLEAGYYEEFRDETVPYRISHEEMAELLDAAEAWELLEHACEQCTEFGRARCGWLLNESGDLLAHVQSDGRHSTPKSAVLAALRPKGEPDGLGDAMP